MKTIYGHDLWNYGSGTLWNCSEGFSHFLRFAAVLLLMIVGMSEVKAQDYSGTYYIASGGTDGNKTNQYFYNSSDPTNNFYLCPTEEWAFYYSTTDVNSTDNGQPFLTTHKKESGDEAKYKWIVERHVIDGVYYYSFKYGIDYTDGESSISRYLSYNRKLSTAGKADRLRIHLEKIASPTDNELFKIIPYSTYLVISPKNTDADDSNKIKYFTINAGNKNTYVGESGKGDGPTNFKNTQGILGTYEAIADINAPFILEDVIKRPTITYSSSNSVTITYPTSETIYYTTDGSDPTTSGARLYFTGTSQSVTITNTKCTVVKAVAYINEKYSNVATYIFLQTGSSKPYLLQSVENANFYMAAGDVSSSTTTVNTISLPQASMSWYFEDAGSVSGVQYFYVSNSTGGYLRRSSNSFYINSTKEDNNDYKFALFPYLNESGTLAGFSLFNIGKTQYIYKEEGNGSSKAVNLTTNANQDIARWNLVLVENKDFSLPITPSDNNSTTYYTFTSSDAPTYLITTPASTYVTTSTGESDSQKWYFQDAGSDGWASYYYILNAITGEAIYFNGTESSATQQDALEMGALPDTPSDNYKFALAKTLADGEYYIVPKPLAQFTKTNYSAIWRGGTYALQTQSNRANSKMKWQINQANFCMPPVFEETGTTITLSCPTKGVEIHYTTDGTIPDVNTTNVVDASTSWSSSTQHGIKAIAVVKDGETVTASSAVVTLINKPDFTFSEHDYTYNGNPHEPGVTSVHVGNTSIDTGYSVSYSEERTNAGEVTVTLTDNVEDNMFIKNASTTFTIGKASLTVTANPKEITYGDAPVNDGVTYTGFVNDETTNVLSGTLSYEYNYSQYGDVGNTYTITPSGLTSTNYEISYVAGTLTVNSKEVSLTWSTPASFDYDGNSHAPTATATGTVNSDVISVTVSPSAKEGSSLTGENAVNAGSYTATASGFTGEKAGNYSLPAACTQDFTISKVALTITAKPNTITYGDEPDNDGVEYSGFVNNETTSVLGGTLGFTYTYEQFGNVGSYTITPKDLTSTNYDITFTSGTLTVTQKEVGLEWPNTSLQYSGTAQVPTANATGLVNNDEISVTVTGAETNIGTGYTATATGLTGDKAGNYKLPTAKTTTFEIIARTLTITAKSKTITYGDAPVNDGVTYDGFITGESETTEGLLTGTLAYDYNYSQYDDVGSYTITPSGLSATNYTITYEAGTLTVCPKEVSLTWSETTTFPYDGSEHAPTASATGTVNSEEVGVTVTGGQTNAGTDYIATASALTGDKAGNYKLPEENTTTFSITAKALTVKAKDKTITYGDEPANDGVEYSGFIEGEDETTEGMFTEELAYDYEYSQYDNVGSYTITPKDLTATNYTITFDTGTLTVEQKEVGITWSSPTSFVYDGQPHVLTATVTDLVNSDVIEVSVTLSAEGESSLTEGGDAVNAGSYTATVSELTGDKARNYALPSEGLSSPFTIAPAELTEVTLSEISSTYNGATQTITISSVKAGELDLSEGDYTVSYSYKQNADNTSETEVTASEIKNAGYYTVNVSPSTSNGNYSGSSTANFTINPLSLGDGTTPATDVNITMDESNNVTVIIGETTLTKYDSEHTNGDYSTESNTDSDGNVVVTITGKNNYSGSAQVMRLNLDFYDTGISSTDDNVKDVAPFQASTDMKTTGKDAYIVTSVNMARHEVGLSKLEYAPGSVPVLLLTDLEETPSDETQPIGNSFTASPIHIETGEEADVSANILKMVSEEGGKEVGFGTVFMFYKGRFVLTSGGTLPKGSFYFDNPNPPSSSGGSSAGARLSIVIGNTTDIDGIKEYDSTDIQDERWFSIDGRRLGSKPTKKGIYLQGGRKKVVK